MCQPVPGGAVLLDTRTEIYFGLNAVGARIWELLADPAVDVPGICAILADEFAGAPVERLRDDVQDLLAALDAAGLVRPHGAA